MDSITNGFRVLPSYYSVLRELPDAERLALYDALFDFGFTLNEPHDLFPIVKGYFTLIKPTLERSVRFFNKQKENGMKGGAPAGNQNARKPCKNNPNSTQNKRDSESDSDSDSAIPKRTRFSPPTLDDVKKYCDERGNGVDAKRFFDYFEAGDWKDSKGNAVRNWKQRVISWERNEEKKESEEAADGTSWLDSAI